MSSISKNGHTDKLDDIVNKYNDTYHGTIKIKPVDLKNDTYFGFNKEKVIIRILSLKLVIMQEY